MLNSRAERGRGDWLGTTRVSNGVHVARPVRCGRWRDGTYEQQDQLSAG